MGGKYNMGSFNDALRYMAECAIRDRRAMIDAYCRFPSDSEEKIKVTKESEREIADFERIYKRLRTKNEPR